MTYSQDLKNPKPRFKAHTTSAGLTAAIDLEGGTLVGLLVLANPTSTTFTVTVSNEVDGTFVLLNDPLNSGTVITYTIAAAGIGYFPINPINTQGFRFCKIQLNQSEAVEIYTSTRNIQ